MIRGLGGSVIRPGWEFNYDWFPWYAGADPASFVMYWQRIVNAMRGVDGAAFTFDWSPNLGGSVELETVYPGDDYVDTIGLDVYNHDWHPGWDDPVTRWSNLRSKEYGLDWHRDFAAARDKPVSFAEWGMITRMDGHGGGDDPYFIEQMYSWIEQGNTAFHIYFNFDTALTTSSLTNGGSLTPRVAFATSRAGGGASAAAAAAADRASFTAAAGIARVAASACPAGSA